MNLNKYNIGAGLNKNVYLKLIDILDEKLKKKDKLRILEFGSGMSTKFFLDYNNLWKKDQDLLEITSFDNDLKWCYKKNENDTCLNLYIRDLIECNENDFNKQMETKIFNKNVFSIRNTPPTWRQRNCFYNIQENDIHDKYDIVIIDGPNGNGRNISYLHFKENLEKESIILIDDFNSCDNEFKYKFVEYAKHFFNLEDIYTYESSNIGDYEKGGNFCFLRVIE
tara:strand:+ start:87 stop:758 length:672 start_codon:yes stop_codon:yes gene_type:complete